MQSASILEHVFPGCTVPSPDTAIATLTSAFVADPVIRWMYPEADDYMASFPGFLRAFGGPAFEDETVAANTADSAVALWMRPGAVPDEAAIVDCLITTVTPVKHADLFAVFEQMDAFHPHFDHWYLPWFGVDASAQGQGLGHALMQHCLERIDADQLPAYLESPNPRNIPFYERFGFRVIGAARHGDCPPLTFMLRDARA